MNNFLGFPQMTESSLVYTNLLIYTPATSEDGLIRMEEAVIPIECHYKRSTSLLLYHDSLASML